MTMYCVFNTQQEAEDAIDYLATFFEMPIICKNKKTGMPAPTKQQTTKWARSLQRDSDSKWVFLQPPKGTGYEMTKGQFIAFQALHPYKAEEFSSDWFSG